MLSPNPALIDALLVVLALIVLDAVLGIAVSLQTRSFDIEQLPDFLATQILPYYIPLASLTLLAQLTVTQNIGTVSVAWAAIVAYALRLICVDIAYKLKLFVALEMSLCCRIKMT